MELHELAPIAGSTQVGKRKGRGTGTGNGKTAGRGHKGPCRLRRRPDASGKTHPEAWFQ